MHRQTTISHFYSQRLCNPYSTTVAEIRKPDDMLKFELAPKNPTGILAKGQ